LRLGSEYRLDQSRHAVPPFRFPYDRKTLDVAKMIRAGEDARPPIKGLRQHARQSALTAVKNSAHFALYAAFPP